MAARKKGSKRTAGPRWFNHRALVLSEAVLATGLIQELLEAWILSLPSVPPLLRVLGAVAVVVGTLGGMMLAMRKRLQDWISGTHGTITSKLPIPGLLAHAAILLGLFAGYCWLWEDETGALSSVARWMGL